MTWPSQRMRILIDLACTLDDYDEKQLTDTDSGTNFDVTSLQDPSSSEEDEEDLEWSHKLPSDKADVHQFVENKMG
jgi:hypothetical protein